MSAYPSQLSSELQRFRDDSSHWRKAGERAAERRNVEEAIALGLHIHGRLERHHRAWTDRLEAKTDTFSMETALHFERAFRDWLGAARAVLALAGQFESEGLAVEQAETLREAVLHCDYDGVSIEQLAASAAQHSAGRGIPGSVVKDEIQRRLRAAGH